MVQIPHLGSRLRIWTHAPNLWVRRRLELLLVVSCKTNSSCTDWFLVAIPLPLLLTSSFQALVIKIIVLNPKFHSPYTLALISISFRTALKSDLISHLKLCTLSLGTLYIKNKMHRAPQMIFCASFNFLELRKTSGFTLKTPFIL